VKKIIPAVIILSLGLLVCLVPWHIFPVCQAGLLPSFSTLKMPPMQCLWAGKAAWGQGALLLAAGFMLLFVPQSAGRGLCLMLTPLGAFILLTPLLLVPVCPGEMMPCRLGTLPALGVLGVLTMLAGPLLYCILKENKRRAKDNLDEKADDF
jgi:hypothetical protein